MSVPIFLSYIDYCREQHKEPDLLELLKWKEHYNNR